MVRANSNSSTDSSSADSSWQRLVAEIARAPEVLPSQLEPGQLAGEYRITGVLGRGSFGTVYRAIQPVIGKEVAVKVLSARFTQSPDVVQRFADEARAVNRIRHPNIVDVFAFGELEGGQKYYVMELLDGRTLAEHLAEQGALPPEQALSILRAVASALDAAHEQRILHRDLKPSNVFLAANKPYAQGLKLLDFGIAKSLESDSGLTTEVGVLIGTPAYMSPEQCKGALVDARSDIYALGVTAYELLTGRRPFLGPQSHQFIAQHLFERARAPSSLRPELSSQVDAAFEKLLHKVALERPPSAALAVGLLEAAFSAPAPARSRARVRTALLFATLLVCLGLGAAWRSRNALGSGANPAKAGVPPALAVSRVPAPAAAALKARPAEPEPAPRTERARPAPLKAQAQVSPPASRELQFEPSPGAASGPNASPGRRQELEY